jgi:hypothetical protein
MPGVCAFALLHEAGSKAVEKGAALLASIAEKRRLSQQQAQHPPPSQQRPVGLGAASREYSACPRLADCGCWDSCECLAQIADCFCFECEWYVWLYM